MLTASTPATPRATARCAHRRTSTRPPITDIDFSADTVRYEDGAWVAPGTLTAHGVSVPDSTLHLLDSGNHILTAAEPAWPELVREVQRFLSAG